MEYYELGTLKFTPCSARPFLFSCWIAVSVTQLEMGIYYDGRTQGEQGNKQKKNCKRRVRGGLKVYIDGLTKYVSHGCEEM